MSEPIFTAGDFHSYVQYAAESYDPLTLPERLAKVANKKVASLRKENAKLKEENEILIAALRVIDRAEPTSDIFNHNHPHSPRVLLKENEKLHAAIEIARGFLLKLIRAYKRRLKAEK